MPVSAAAQMLNASVAKSEQMQKHLGNVINDESKRLRFVEKGIADEYVRPQEGGVQEEELDLNEMVENIANSFSLPRWAYRW